MMNACRYNEIYLLNTKSAMNPFRINRSQGPRGPINETRGKHECDILTKKLVLSNLRARESDLVHALSQGQVLKQFAAPVKAQLEFSIVHSFGSHVLWALGNYISTVTTIFDLSLTTTGGGNGLLGKDLGLSMVDLSILYAGGGLAISMFGIVWGVLADRMSRKVLLVSSCIGWGSCSLAGSMAQSTATLFASPRALSDFLTSHGRVSRLVMGWEGGWGDSGNNPRRNTSKPVPVLKKFNFSKCFYPMGVRIIGVWTLGPNSKKNDPRKTPT